MSAAARRGDLQGRLMLASRDGDPFPLFEEIRAEGALYRGRFSYIATGLATVREVLSSNDCRTGFDPTAMRGGINKAYLWSIEDERLGPLEPPSLLVTEPPDHTRYRKLVSRVFSVRAVDKVRTRAEEIAEELLGQMAGQRRVDLVEQYCALLPVTIIAEILGVPAGER